MKRLLVALVLVLLPTAVWAQGCGPHNPNCIVVTQPPGTSNNTAASTAFVSQAIGGGGGAVTSVTSPTSTLTISPTSGAVNADINLAHPNTWSATQTFSGVTLSGITGGGTVCLQADNSGVVSSFGAGCGGGGGGSVNSVSNSDGSLTISPTTGAVVASIALGHTNTWTIKQLFNGSAGSPGSGIGTFNVQIGTTNSPGIGISDTAAIGLWSSSNGTQFNIGFAANASSSLNTIAQFSNSTAVSSAALTLSPAASSLAVAMRTTQSGSGTPTGNCTGCVTGVYTYNLIDISADNLVANALPGAAGLSISMTQAGASATGERASIYTSFQLTGADSTSSNTCPCYVGVVNEIKAAVNDHGTGNTFPNARGQMFGWNPRLILASGATNWEFIEGMEIDMQVDAGASVANKIGSLVVLQPGDANQGGSIYDNAYSVTDTGSSGGFKGGFVAIDIFGTSGIATNGTFVGTQFAGGPYTINNGVDLRGFTISTFAFVSGTSSFGFGVNQHGDTIASSYSVIDTGVQTSGVTCTAGSVNAATFTAKLGIVTHC